MLFPTPPLNVIDQPVLSTHYTRGRGGFAPEIIVLHHTGGIDSLAWLSRTSSPPVSTHRLIKKSGTIYKLVADADTAYTAGFGIVGPVDPDTNDPAGVARNLNQVTLHIELENMGNGSDPYPAAQLQSCAAQIVEWWGRYGLLPILDHRQVDGNKNDPRGLDRTDLDRRILALLPGGALTLPPEVAGDLSAAVESARAVIGRLGAVLAWQAAQS